MARIAALALLLAVAQAFTVQPVAVPRMATRAAVTRMETEGQVEKFEKGSDFLFFQSPAPATADQDDLPSFFSGDNVGDFQLQGPVQIAVTATGLVSFAAVLSVVLA